ncbi:Efflux pump dotC-like protein [Elsinoe fawcettii]|nr:Efflux pump dotC-like protein [Elsinoe fawcettii]
MTESKAGTEVPSSNASRLQTPDTASDSKGHAPAASDSSPEHKQKSEDVLPSDSSTLSPQDKDSSGDAPPKSPPDEPNDFEKSSVGKRTVIMAALCMAVFLAALDVTIITTALPTISEEFQSAAGYTWIGSAFLLGNASSVPTWGKVSDIFGRKPVLLAANIVFFIGSLVAALANSIGMMIAARAVQGIGAGGLVILVNITIADLFSLRNRGAYYGVIGMVWAFASAIGPIIGGAFTQNVTWRWCFWVNLPFIGLTFLIVLFFLDVKTPKTPIIEGLKAIDWLGSLTVVGATLMFLLGIEYGGVTYPWSSAIVVCLIVFGIVTFGVFMLIQWKVSRYPVMPLSIFSKRSTCACLFIVSIHGMVFIASSYYLPLYFQASLGAGPLRSGVLLLPTCGALSVTSLGTGFYIRKTGRYLDCIYFGFFFMTLGYGLFIDLAADSSLAKIVIYQLIAGFGIGPLFQSPLIALQSRIKPRDIATATATFGFVRQLSTSISVVIGGVIYQNEMRKRSAQLIDALGPQNGNALSGAGAGANTQLVNNLPEPGKGVAQDAFADSLSTMWILFVALSGVGLLATPLIGTKELSGEHQEAKTGLEAEREKEAERKKEEEEKRARKGRKSLGDVEAPPATTAPVSEGEKAA